MKYILIVCFAMGLMHADLIEENECSLSIEDTRKNFFAQTENIASGDNVDAKLRAMSLYARYLECRAEICSPKQNASKECKLFFDSAIRIHINSGTREDLNQILMQGYELYEILNKCTDCIKF